MTNNLIKLFFILITIALPCVAMAQIDIDPSCDPLDPGCPIDGGLSALLAIGTVYGIKKIKDAKKTNNHI